MLLPASLVAVLSSLPASAHAQRAPQRAAVAPSAAAETPAMVCPAPLRTPVALGRPGVHPTLRAGLRLGLDVVDTMRVDVDGDGDPDQLALVDVAESDEGPKPDDGRGVVVAFREEGGWRIETVASLPRFPVEAGYNWGPVEARRDRRPVLHVRYSAASAGRFERRDTAVRFDPTANGLRLECAPAHERAAAHQHPTRRAHSPRRTLARN